MKESEMKKSNVQKFRRRSDLEVLGNMLSVPFELKQRKAVALARPEIRDALKRTCVAAKCPWQLLDRIEHNYK